MSAQTSDPTPADRNDAEASALAQRAELIRALGAIALTPPPVSDDLCEAVGLGPVDPVDHTEAFVLLLPPHAAIHLGPDGQLGGEGLDRIEGFWRALGLAPPADADHLGVLLMAYADLLDQTGHMFAEPVDARTDPAARAAATLFHEHIWPFAPGYLTALTGVGLPGVSAWAELVMTVLRAEYDRHPAPPTLPLALREAPEPIDVGIGFGELLDAVVTPARIGVVLTQRDLAAGAAEVGLGYRRGERRYALKAMLEQDKASTLAWLGRLARRRAGDSPAAADADRVRADLTTSWWIGRAHHSADVLATLAAQARLSPAVRATADAAP